MADSHNNEGAVERAFTASARAYTRYFDNTRSGRNAVFRQRLALAVQMTSGLRGSVLDCACGPAQITEAILASGAFTDATLVDISPEMLELAKQRFISCEDAEAQPLKRFALGDIFEFAARSSAGRYDLVICLGLIAHTGRVPELFRLLSSLLAPGGRILLQSTLLDHFGTKVVSALTSARHRRRYGYEISYFRHSDLVAAARGAGLALEQFRRFAAGIPFVDRFFPRASYELETRLSGWARAHGSEALYIFRRDNTE